MSATISWLSSALLAATVTSTEPPLDLEWQAPPSCPERDWALARLASDARLTKLEKPTRVRVQLREAEDAFVADLSTAQGDEEGTRTLEAATCEELAEAVIVVLGMALVPRPDDASQQKAAPPEPPRTKPPVVVAEPLPPEPRGSTSESLAFLRVGVGADRGSLPSTTFGVALAGGIHFGVASLELRGSYWLPRAARAEDPQGVADGADVGGDFARADALLFGCGETPLVGIASAQGCLGAGVGMLRAEGYGVPEPVSEQRFFGVVAGELGVPLRLSNRVAVRLGVSVLVPTSRETYAIGSLGPVFTPAPVGFRAEIASEVRF